MIKNIIFDCGRVIMQYDEKYISSFFTDNEQDAELLATVGMHRKYWNDFDEGTLTEEVYLERVKKELPERLHTAVENLVANWTSHMPPVEGIESVIEEIKASGKGLYLLSNFNKRLRGELHLAPSLLLFDGIVISGEIGLVKPNTDIYEYLLKKHGLDASECLFVDDRADNIEAGDKVGIKGYIFDGDADTLDRSAGGLSDRDQPLQGTAVGQKVIHDQKAIVACQKSLGYNDLIFIFMSEGFNLGGIHVTVDVHALGLLGKHHRNAEGTRRGIRNRDAGGLDRQYLGNVGIGKSSVKFLADLVKQDGIHLVVQEIVHLEDVAFLDDTIFQNARFQEVHDCYLDLHLLCHSHRAGVDLFDAQARTIRPVFFIKKKKRRSRTRFFSLYHFLLQNSIVIRPFLQNLSFFHFKCCKRLPPRHRQASPSHSRKNSATKARI